MSRSTIASLLAAAVLISGCGSPVASDAVGPNSSGAASGSQPVAASALERPRLPDGFPVLPGATTVAPANDDAGLIAAWNSDRLGSAAYDFYVDALPQAGYRIVGTYPGGDVALIRFRAPGGAIWQVVAYGGVSGATRIEIRLDRP